jgi:chromosomal replication initiation ATPase DnaA
MANLVQLPLDLPHRPAQGRDDFLVAACNAEAVAWVDTWPNWPGAMPGVAIHGPAAAGKSHLAAVWQAASGAVYLDAKQLSRERLRADLQDHRHVIVDNLDEIASPEAVFHLFNLVVERKGSLLTLSRQAPGRLRLGLSDLESRLAILQAVAISPPDEALLAGVMRKLFRDRQLLAGDDVVDYLMIRIERSFAAVDLIVTELDRTALARQRKVTLSLARQVLSQGKFGA